MSKLKPAENQQIKDRLITNEFSNRKNKRKCQLIHMASIKKVKIEAKATMEARLIGVIWSSE